MDTCLIEQFQEPLQFADYMDRWKDSNIYCRCNVLGHKQACWILHVFSAHTHPGPLNLADKSTLFIAVQTVPTTAAAAAA